jgi:Mrp family chromosome partitioning ATPase
VALKLALVTADKARRVLVVDASATAGLTGMLGLAGRPGLAQLAAGASPSDVVHRTEIDHLAVVAAGEGAGADLTEADWPRIVRQLSGMADVVFFDLPPILTSTLAPKVSAACDGLVLVVAAHRTRREAIRQAKAKLEYAGDVKLLGAILNGREYFIPDFLYRRA